MSTTTSTAPNDPVLAPAATPFPALASSRLNLREITLADADAMFAIYGDAQAMRWFGMDAMTEVAQAETTLTRWATMRQQAVPAIRWGIQVAGESTLSGSCGLFGWNRDWRKCTLGYDLVRSAQGQGYMQEALSTVLDWGFANMELNRIEAQIHPDNLASLKLIRKLGFREEGLLREVAFWSGAHHDLLQFALLRREWRVL